MNSEKRLKRELKQQQLTIELAAKEAQRVKASKLAQCELTHRLIS